VRFAVPFLKTIRLHTDKSDPRQHTVHYTAGYKNMPPRTVATASAAMRGSVSAAPPEP